MQPGDLARIAPLSSCAYFFDADCTLLDIMPRQEDVVADARSRTLLAGLAGAARGALGLVGPAGIASDARYRRHDPASVRAELHRLRRRD